MSDSATGCALVTGGAGFIGSNLADRLARDGMRVVVLDSLARPGVERNLAWLESRYGDRIERLVGDIRDRRVVAEAAREAQVVFHLAGQVAVTSSLEDPVEDFEVNLKGTLNILEIARDRRVPVIFASTNKVYGDLADIDLELVDEAYLPVDRTIRSSGIGEARPLDFHTPYGCSKGGADQYVLDYSRSFGVPTCVMRMSCIYGPRQMGTEDQGWVAHFLIRALKGETISIFGDGRQVRDVLFVGDAVEAYLSAWRNIEAVSGQAFNLGGGASNAVSLRRLVAHIEDLIGRRVDLEFHDWRAGDQRYFVADAAKARGALGLAAPVAWREGVAELANWLRSEGAAAPKPLEVASL
ncbi:SDR family NAD(P)-dependent oxidoreductase [Hansschlegelia quercus]|uniref:SDR family NAD(P)-dependent oxidoreductase n=1 Tax=Hansschlegelia quercus TaxID=2528245 RepID=UPI001FDF29ED|nr:SDR family NAD(P)-dependent oxidoreductase [Hansschlegelia quercus]